MGRSEGWRMTNNGSKTVLLEERIGIGKAPPGGRVDRECKLIRGVKILGFHSRNPGAVLGKDFADLAGYDYDPAAINAALPLYEGAPVNLDHLESKRDGNGMRIPNGTRQVKQRFGRLRNVRVESDGAYADIHYLDNHPLTPMVLEAAEEMPDVFTMSHHAHGEVDKGPNNRGKVTKINQVHSVDLIAERPGTTTSLFESSSMDDDSDGTMTSEATAAQAEGTAGGSSNKRKAGSQGAPGGRGSQGSFCKEVIAACNNGQLDLAGTVFQVLQAIVKVAGSAGSVKKSTNPLDDSSDAPRAAVEEEDADADAEESADDDGSDQAMAESLAGRSALSGLRKRIRLLEAREQACILLSQRGLTLTSELITAVAAQKSAQAQQALIESLSDNRGRTSIGAATGRGALKPLVSRPRSAAPLFPTPNKGAKLGLPDATQDLLVSLGRARLQ
jgi:hypothetical protein